MNLTLQLTAVLGDGTEPRKVAKLTAKPSKNSQTIRFGNICSGPSGFLQVGQVALFSILRRKQTLIIFKLFIVQISSNWKYLQKVWPQSLVMIGSLRRSKQIGHFSSSGGVVTKTSMSSWEASILDIEGL